MTLTEATAAIDALSPEDKLKVEAIAAEIHGVLLMALANHRHAPLIPLGCVEFAKNRIQPLPTP